MGTSTKLVGTFMVALSFVWAWDAADACEIDLDFQWLGDSVEYWPYGGFLQFNDDDDDSDGQLDYQDPDSGLCDDEVRALTLARRPPSNEGTVTLRLAAGSATGKVKVWKTILKGAENEIAVEGAGTTWDLSTEGMPWGLGIEGVAPSGSVGDVKLELVWSDGPGEGTVVDRIKLTVIRCDIDIVDPDVTEADERYVLTSILTSFGRRKVTLRQTEPYGIVILTRDGTVQQDMLKVFDAPTGGNEIQFDGQDNKFNSSQLPKTLYVEGSQTEGDAWLRLRAEDRTLTAAGYSWEIEDYLSFKVTEIDIDIDSDNNNDTGRPDRSAYEDSVEDVEGDSSKPGKFLNVSMGDTDEDCIPDFADGFDLDGTPGNGDDGSDDLYWVKMVLEVPSTVDFENATVEFTYSASEPASVNKTGSEPLYAWTPASGNLRIWTKNGDQARNKANVSSGGDFVASGTTYDATDLGFSASVSTRMFHVEGIAAGSGYGSERIKVDVDPDGAGSESVRTDAVRTTIAEADVDVDSNNDGTTNTVDDHIEAQPPGCIVPETEEGDVAGQDCLKAVSLSVSPVLSACDVVLSAGSGVKIWADQAKTTEISLPKTYTSPADLPATVWVDGLTRGSNPAIQLTYKTDDYIPIDIAEDSAKVFVTDTISWAPKADDVAYVWSSLPSLGEGDANDFKGEIDVVQGFAVVWYGDSTGKSDNDFKTCTLANYQNMPNSGAFCVISHGSQGAHYAVYATGTPAGKTACDSWRSGQGANMTTAWVGSESCWSVRVSSNWLNTNYKGTCDANNTITFWDICHSASAGTGEPAVKEAAGGRWRIGYLDTTGETECRAVNQMFLKRMNGKTDDTTRRTAGRAWDGGTNYPGWPTLNVQMDGNDWTTLCPAPMHNDPVWPASNPGDRYGWGCVVFDTYMNDNYSAASALVRVTGGPTYAHTWAGNTYGKSILGFDFDKTGGGATTMKAEADNCRNKDGAGKGRKLDQNRVAPNGDDRTWSY